MDVWGRKRLASPPHHRSSAASAPCFFTRGNFLLFSQFSHAVPPGGLRVDTPGRAAFTLGVFSGRTFGLRSRLALRFFTHFFFFRCVKEAFCGRKRVFFLCVPEGESGGGGGGGRRRGGVWEVAAPDADPLTGEQRGGGGKTVQIAAETQKVVASPANHAENPHLVLRPRAPERSLHPVSRTDTDRFRAPDPSDRTVRWVIDFRDAAVIDGSAHSAEGYQSVQL